MAFHLDYESRSDSDLRKVGGYRYANNPTTRILMFAICEDDGPVILWDHLDPNGDESVAALALFKTAIRTKAMIYAHNAPFELAVTRYRGKADLGLDELPHIDQWRCVLAMCRKAALPVALGAVADLLKLDVQKDEMGKGFIEVFSTPKEVILRAPEGEKIYDRSDKGRRADNRRTTNPLDGWQEKDGTRHDEILWDWLVSVKGEEMTVREAWTRFKEYCKRDVELERLVHKKLHTFELVGDSLASFQFNLRMNDRGIPVNIKALKHAQKLILQYQKLAHTRFRNLTGLTPTQGAKFKAWLTERGYFGGGNHTGVWESMQTKARLQFGADHVEGMTDPNGSGTNLQSDTVEHFLKNYTDFLTPEALRALTMYRLLNFAALAKVPAMLAMACDDGFVRGTMLWHGARTGRATGKGIQPQNFKKAKEATDVAYEMLCDECTLEDFEEFFASPLEMIASCARHFIHHPGKRFYDCDFVGVEARLTPWAVGDQDKLDSILAGVDQYKRVATMVFDTPYESVTKAQRTIAKPVELGCCFGVAGLGLKTGLAGPPYNTKISAKEAHRIVKVYRDNHPKTVAAWREMEDAAKVAITEGKTTLVLDGKVKFGRVKAAGMVYLVMVIPSGRRLYYPSPRMKQKFIAYTIEEMAEHEWKRDKRGYWRDEIQFWGTVPNTNGAKWGFVGTYGSRLFENCLTADTEVLTERGWVPIVEAANVRVFDGVEFVSHAGLRETLSSEVIRLDGLGITPNHRVLTSKGWIPASAVITQDAYDYFNETCSWPTSLNTEYNRTEGGEPHGHQTAPTSGRREIPLGVQVQVRSDLREDSATGHSQREAGNRAMLSILSVWRESQGQTSHVVPSGLRGLSVDAGSLQLANPSGVSQLWWAGHHGLRKVAGVLRELLGRYGRVLQEGPDLGPAKQHGELHLQELPLDQVATPVRQQADERLGRHAAWPDDSIANIGSHRDRSDHHPLPLESGGAGLGATDGDAGRSQPVYDLYNCGPRQRFVVRAPGGQPLIAHNCIQAMGADLLDQGCIAAVKAGFDIFLIVHDQALCYERDDATIKDFEREFCNVGNWAKTFPLAADGCIVNYYTKELD